MPVSVGGLAAHPEVLDWAHTLGGRIRVATGALPGLDAIRAAAEGEIRSLRLTSRIRPDSLVREAYIRAQGFDFTKPLEEPVEVLQEPPERRRWRFPGTSTSRSR